MLVVKWLTVGYILSLSYKAVLRPILMTTEYEKSIDNLDDLLASNKKLFAAIDAGFGEMIGSDPRMKVRELFKKNQVEYYTFGTGVRLEWLWEG